MTLHLENRLLQRAKLGNLRKLQIIQAPIDFSSNDYLGLARSPKLVTSVFQEWERYLSRFNGLGSTGSRLLTGNSLYAQKLEEKIAKFHNYEAGLLFSCGYMANVGLLSAIANQESVIFYDTAVHASIHDGIRLSRAKAFPFRHNDLKHLENRLKNCSFQKDRFICIESIYSTDGSMAQLPEISQLARKYEAHLIVDEAHAVGVCGPQGRGLVAKNNLMAHVFAQVITFGKALGTYGAIVLGSHTLKQALINFATSYIYTTALPFQTLAAINCSYALFPQMDRERDQLRKLIQIFRKSYSGSSLTHIQSVLIEGNETVKQVAQAIVKQGFDVRPLMSPTVQRGREALRICLHAFNIADELEQLISHIQLLRSP
ncbi:MAG: pyridoxal phosphate-dependent aminotransferase family protein [Chlamydiales bacterium]|jgi:8-amino-7-oxononanoate synthase|nr:pyridoxal phosphate-dependent aminotransferase family protein [Chlamydiales bacterium]